eukprot:TRINITY_DN8503_c0_g1_i1.p1 TRINITY_DN8503_c0_g1~~TRINITY_DN8503_c0_g1_i1.p1  ORF type:complete len:1099 (-),score=302.28 TRINITY_DN8503_c0_g1_i1:838-4134(-)
MSAEPEPPLKDGFLYKLGDKGVVKLWKRRWFSLRNNRIYYCDEKDAWQNKFVGNIPLTKDSYVAFTVLAASINPPKKNCTFQIQCHSNPRIWILCADTPSVKDDWITAINSVIDSDSALPVASDGSVDAEGSFIGRSSLVRSRSRKDNLSEPKDFRHRAHVDFEFNWSGQRAEDIFELHEKLGQGAYGAVYVAKHRETGFELAVKIVPIRAECIDSLSKEVDVLKKCKNNNLLSYYGTVRRESEVWILMDVCQVGSVKEVMQLTLEPLTQDQMAHVACETLKGLVYLHAQDIIHLDVKAANIMITAEGNVKIGDFGVSETLRENVSIEATDFVGSPLYMAPEVIKKDRYSKNADIWSLGITMIEMADTRPPNTDITSMAALPLLLKRPPPTVRRPNQYSSQFNDFIAQCLVPDPEKRPSAMDMLMHSFARGAKGPIVFQGVIRSIMLIRAEMRERQLEEKRLRELEEQQQLVLRAQDKTKVWKILGPENLQPPPSLRAADLRAPLSRIGESGGYGGGAGYRSDAAPSGPPLGSPMSPLSAASAPWRTRSNSDQAFILTTAPAPLSGQKPVADSRKTSSAPPNLEPNLYPPPGPSESGDAIPTPTPSSPSMIPEAAIRKLAMTSSGSWRNSSSHLLGGSPQNSPNLSQMKSLRLGAARLSLGSSEFKELEGSMAASPADAAVAPVPSAPASSVDVGVVGGPLSRSAPLPQKPVSPPGVSLSAAGSRAAEPLAAAARPSRPGPSPAMRMPNVSEVKETLAEVESKINRVNKDRDAARSRGETLIATQLTSTLTTLDRQREVLERTVALLPRPLGPPGARVLSPTSSTDGILPPSADDRPSSAGEPPFLRQSSDSLGRASQGSDPTSPRAWSRPSSAGEPASPHAAQPLSPHSVQPPSPPFLSPSSSSTNVLSPSGSQSGPSSSAVDAPLRPLKLEPLSPLSLDERPSEVPSLRHNFSKMPRINSPPSSGPSASTATAASLAVAGALVVNNTAGTPETKPASAPAPISAAPRPRPIGGVGSVGSASGIAIGPSGIAIGPSASKSVAPLGPRRVLGPAGLLTPPRTLSPALVASPSAPAVGAQATENGMRRSPSAPAGAKPT